MEINETLEGKKTDNLEATSASESTETVLPVELNNTTTPTEEERADAGISDTTETPVETETTVTADVQSDTAPVEGEIVTAEKPLVYEDESVTETPALRTFTQEEVNGMVGTTRTETREKTFRYIYDRYGVNSEEELDELIGNAQRYDSLQEEYSGAKNSWKEQSEARDKELADVKEQVALMQSGIDSGRYEDAKFILRGKGLEVTLENINNELATHPEWKKSEDVNPNFVKTGPGQADSTQAEPESTISVLGNSGGEQSAPQETEEDYAMKHLFKV